MIPKVSILTAAYNEAHLITKGLDSVPRRNDLEVIVRDDGSTDNTWDVLVKYKADHPELNLTILRDEQNHGCFYNVNRLLEHATGEYIHFMDGDDWLYTDEYVRAMAQLYGEDCVYIDLQINNGFVFRLQPESRRSFCAPTTKFVRRKFAEGIKFPEDRVHDGDWFYNEDLLARNPVCKYTGIIAYHYNNPREGSLYDLVTKGLL